MIWHFFTSLLRDERGASVIEMSFILPVLVTLGCGASDLAMCYARQLKLQQSAARTAEFAIAYGSKGNLVTTLQSEAANAADVPTGSVTVDTWLECDGVRQANVSDICIASSPARFASVAITDTYTWTMAQVVPSWSGSVPLRGFATVRVQ